MRTLVIGLPLPHVSFDNYNFLSAPSLSEYGRLVVEMSAVSAAVEAVAGGSAEYLTFDRQPVVNAETAAGAFGLADLLRMRAAEAAHFFECAGSMLCLAYPDAVHTGIAGIERWRRYEWLPALEGFDYRTGLRPAFGLPGAEVVDDDHPFAPLVAAFSARLAYRVYLADGDPALETGGRVFARSGSGRAVGFELPVGRGRIVFLPPLASYEQQRTEIARAIFEGFERIGKRGEEARPVAGKEAG
jgi:hypothetical protein